MSFVHGANLTEAIQRVVRVGPADVAVAFWGNGACEKLGLPTDLHDYRIACDARSGACSPATIKELLWRGAMVVDVASLHAKVYCSSAGMVVASANASGNGLSEDTLESAGLEAGFFVNSDVDITRAREWLDKIFQAGTPLTEADLPELNDLWKASRTGRIIRQPLCRAILAGGRGIADRGLRVYLYTAENPPAEMIERFQSSPYFDEEAWKDESYPFFCGELNDVQVGDELLCFEFSGPTASCERVWKVLAKIGQGEQAIWPVAEVARPLGRILGDPGELTSRVERAVRRGRLKLDGPPISLSALAAAVSQAAEINDHLQRLRSQDARAAYLHLFESAEALGFQTKFSTGFVPAVQWWDSERTYLHSFIVNRDDLLFYLRLPAQRKRKGLLGLARASGFGVATNRNNEGQIRIKNRDQARQLTDWLMELWGDV